MYFNVHSRQPSWRRVGILESAVCLFMIPIFVVVVSEVIEKKKWRTTELLTAVLSQCKVRGET